MKTKQLLSDLAEAALMCLLCGLGMIAGCLFDARGWLAFFVAITLNETWGANTWWGPSLFLFAIGALLCMLRMIANLSKPQWWLRFDERM